MRSRTDFRLLCFWSSLRSSGNVRGLEWRIGACDLTEPARSWAGLGWWGWRGGMADVAVLRSVGLFLVAALAEIGGAWLVWQAVREHRGLWFAGAGVVALGAYGFVATLQPDPNFGRILAAYGGVFVAGSLGWGMLVDGYRPIATT
jgi:small multidrug resistance family-3 protein